MKETALFLLTGILAGISSGIFGIGGGIILIPILVLGFGFSQISATGTSLVALLLPVGVLGVMNYYQAGKIDSGNIRTGLTIAVGVFFGTYFGSAIAVSLSENMLRKLFAGLLFIISIRLFLAPKL